MFEVHLMTVRRPSADEVFHDRFGGEGGEHEQPRRRRAARRRDRSTDGGPQ